MSTASVTHDYFKRGFEAEVARSRALDGKTAGLMGFSSVLAGLMIPFTALTEKALADALAVWPLGRLVVQLMFIAAVLLLFAAIFCFFRSSRVRGYRQPPRFEPADIAAVQALDEDQLKLRFAAGYQRYWQHNKNHNDEKARWTQRGFAVLMTGGAVAVLSVCWIIVTFIVAGS
jgi:hypothetical protein